MERLKIQQMFIRFCRDSKFNLPATQAAILAANTLGIHPLEVWMALDWSNMERIAAGEHPALANRIYG